MEDAAAPEQPLRRHQQRHRRIVFTLNNYTDYEYKNLTEWCTGRCVWMVIGKETGENGTPHLQGAMCFGKAYLFTTIKAWDGLKRAHIEGMRGSPQASLEYCSKQDKNPFIWGKMPEQGKRTDITMACDILSGGATMEELASENGAVVVKYFKGLTVYKSLIAPPRQLMAPTVYWLYGKTGTGKTRCAIELGNLCHPNSVWISNDSLQWFDGYDGQTCAIFDDFRPKGVRFNFLLRLLDMYPLRVPIKGAYVAWRPELIFITTPNSIECTFAKRAEHIPEDIAQLERRITRTFYFPDKETELRELFVGSQ